VAVSDFSAIKNLGNTRIAYKPRHTHTHTHPETLEARENPRWQLVTQLLTDHNTQGWEDDIKMDLRKIGIDGANWIWLAQDRVPWRVFVNTVMNRRVP
jgi:hypothetical protein